LKDKLAMPSQTFLREFVEKNADGFGNPLPQEVPANFALAALCINGSIEDIPHSAKLEQKEAQGLRRAARQREARACRRLRLQIIATRGAYHRVDLYKRSTLLIASGALLTRAFSGSAHYSEQIELLRLIGVYRQEDFVRDRLDALRDARPEIYGLLAQRAEDVIARRSITAVQQRQLFSSSR
jgi:hypothetical protein